MIVAQLSDLHIRPPGFPLAFGKIDTTALAERALARLAALRPKPDIAVITGDLADCGRPEEYEILRDLLGRLDAPTLFVPGNHDDRDGLRKIFLDWPGLDFADGFVQFCAEFSDLRVIGLDTLVPGEGHGALCETRLGWLSDRLAQRPETPTLLAMHHPPFRVGNRFLDTVRLTKGTDQLQQIVRRNPQVSRLLCGHHHRSIDAIFGGAMATVAPAVVNAIALELGAGRGVQAIAEPPAFKLHVVLDDRELVSHTVYVDDYGGAFSAPPDPAYPAMASFSKDAGAG